MQKLRLISEKSVSDIVDGLYFGFVKSNFCLFELVFQKGDGLFGGFNLGLLDFKPFNGFKIHLPEFLIAFAELNVFDFKIF